MKKWPTRWTNVNGVSVESLRRWYKHKEEISISKMSLEWLKGLGNFPDGVAQFEKSILKETSALEAARLQCRREDIESRQMTRWRERHYREPAKPKFNGWQPTEMTYDQYLDRNRKLRD